MLSIIHTIAHFFNFRILFDHFRNVNQERYADDNPALARKLQEYLKPNPNWINPVSGDNQVRYTHSAIIAWEFYKKLIQRGSEK